MRGDFSGTCILVKNESCHKIISAQALLHEVNSFRMMYYQRNDFERELRAWICRAGLRQDGFRHLTLVPSCPDAVPKEDVILKRTAILAFENEKFGILSLCRLLLL